MKKKELLEALLPNKNINAFWFKDRFVITVKPLLEVIDAIVVNNGVVTDLQLDSFNQVIKIQDR